MPDLLYRYIINISALDYWVYGMSTIVGYLMPNPFYTYVLNIFDLVGLGWVLWHIKYCRLFNAKSSSYIFIKCIISNLVRFNGITTIVGHLMPNHLYTCIKSLVNWFCKYILNETGLILLYIVKWFKAFFSIKHKYLYFVFIIPFHTIKWFKVILYIDNNSIE